MSERTPPARSLASERFASIVERFEAEAKKASQLVAEAEEAAKSDLASRHARTDAELSAIRAVRNEIDAVSYAVLQHSAVRSVDGLAEENDPQPTVLDDPSPESLRRLVRLRRERALAMLADLRVDDLTDGGLGGDDNDGPPGPPDEIVLVRNEPETQPVVTPSQDVDRSDEPTSDAEPMAASTSVVTETLDDEGTIKASVEPAAEAASAGRPRRAPYPWLVGAFAIALVAVPNLWPRMLDRAPFVCSVPIVRGLVPCDRRALSAESGSGGTRSPTDGTIVSSDVAARLATIVRQDGGTLTVPPGVHEVRGPVALSGDVTIQGASSDQSILRITSRGAGISYSGSGVLRVSGVGLSLASSGTGDVLSASSGTVRLNDVAFSGGTAGGGAVGAGLLLGGSVTGTVADCVVRDNGTGIWVSDRAAPSISGCKIGPNQARGIGYFGRSSGELVDNTIEGNGYMPARDDYWQGIALEDGAAPSIRDNVIQNNAGIGVQYRDNSAGRFVGNTVVGNGSNIRTYAPSTASVGGVAIGTRGTGQQPSPSIGSGNRYEGNYGGDLNDYR